MIINYNSTQLEIRPNDDSYRYRAIMGEHSLTLMFSLEVYIEFPIGTYCEFEGETYTLEKPFSFTEKHSRQFDYTLIMDASQGKLSKYKLKNIVDKRLKFNLTAKPITHLQQIIDNLNLRESGWTMGICIDSTEKVISYNHTFIIDALNQIASEFETEWEINEKVISLRKVEYNKDNPLPLSYGKGNGFKPGITIANEEGKKAIEILYVQGGERNIDFSKYGNRELLLPKSQQLEVDGRIYETDAEGFSIHRADKALVTNEEDSLDCSHIYPSRVGSVSSVIVVDADKNFYDFTDVNIPEDLNFAECLIAGSTMTVIFQSGILTGKEFEVAYSHTERKFAIVPQEIDGQTMPNETFKPVIGDTYAVFNMMMPDAYICDNDSKTGASWDMFREAIEYFYENENPKFLVNGELDGIWSKKDWSNIGIKIKIGGYISFTGPKFPDAVLIRITGIKDYINNPHSPIMELSNTTGSISVSSELKKLDAKEVYTEAQHQEAIQFTKRTFRNAAETLTLLQNAVGGFTNGISPVTVQTMALLIGDNSLQYRFVNNKTEPVEVEHQVNFDSETMIFTSDAGIIQHMTLGIDIIKPTREVSDYKFWDVVAFESPPLADTSKAYYIYIKASKTTENAEFSLSETVKDMTSDPDYYYFLMGILSSEVNGDRNFALLYGFTEILPGQITTKVVATDTLLAELAKIADWVIRNGKITSEGLTNDIPWAELNGTDGNIKFEKDMLLAFFGLINGSPGFKLTAGDITLETQVALYEGGSSTIDFRISHTSGHFISLSMEDTYSRLIFYDGETKKIDITENGIEIYGLTQIQQLANQRAGLIVIPTGSASSMGAAIFASSENIDSPNKRSGYFKGSIQVEGNIYYTGSLIHI